MRTLACLLLLRVISAKLAIAQDIRADYGFSRTEDLRTEGYDFKLLKTVPDKNHWRMGFFQFRWKGEKAIRLWGFGFEKDGSFRVRFEGFSKMSQRKWAEVPVGYCGTGAEMFTLEPNKDYLLQIPLWPYKAGGEEGTVKLGGEKISLVSVPFKMEEVIGAGSGSGRSR